MQLADTWIFTTSAYIAFVHTKDLDKLADQWEQYELAQIELMKLIKDET